MNLGTKENKIWKNNCKLDMLLDKARHIDNRYSQVSTAFERINMPCSWNGGEKNKKKKKKKGWKLNQTETIHTSI